MDPYGTVRYACTSYYRTTTSNRYELRTTNTIQQTASSYLLYGTVHPTNNLLTKRVDDNKPGTHNQLIWRQIYGALPLKGWNHPFQIILSPLDLVWLNKSCKIRHLENWYRKGYPAQPKARCRSVKNGWSNTVPRSSFSIVGWFGLVTSYLLHINTNTTNNTNTNTFVKMVKIISLLALASTASAFAPNAKVCIVLYCIVLYLYYMFVYLIDGDGWWLRICNTWMIWYDMMHYTS